MEFKLFPAFFDKPTNISFSEVEPNEVIELVLRRHFVTNLGWIFITLIALILPVIFLQVDQTARLNLLPQIPSQILISSIIVYYLLVLAYAVESFLSWYFNIYIITNLHLVQIKLNNLLNKEVIENQYNDVQSVSAKVMGLLQELFNYGDIVIETAAKDVSIVFARVPRPDFVADRISDLQTAAETPP